ncbi:solute carrier family 25 member 45 isoform X3 [Pteropus vampyrus]|uniref:Solute carrier family 25 member 45 isoform X3 n=1 Tax=Pteropus vampyrus TaxID=132908 RepID=A0A6P6CVC4_PTEVA|nr:solute carrier family 25 member 45 isoform X3 [Pteropus vampyrus]
MSRHSLVTPKQRCTLTFICSKSPCFPWERGSEKRRWREAAFDSHAESCRKQPWRRRVLKQPGAVGLVLGHPFDTVKVRLQTQTAYRGIVDCVVKTYRHESACCLAPFDLVKVRLQNQTEPRAQLGSPPPRYRGPVHCVASIFREEGPRGLFRGAWALMLRDTPPLGLYFVTYEWLCRQSTPDGQNPSSATVLVAGGFAGTTSWMIATPLDVIKSRMQMAGLKQREYRGVLDCIVSSARQEGLGVFFRGLTINSARAFPVNAVTFLSYEYLLHSWA